MTDYVPADRQTPYSPNFKTRAVLSCGHFVYADEVYGAEYDAPEALCGVCRVERSVIKP